MINRLLAITNRLLALIPASHSSLSDVTLVQACLLLATASLAREYHRPVSRDSFSTRSPLDSQL